MSEEVTIYYNPKCSTCQRTLDLLEKRGTQANVVEYLKDTPDRETLKSLVGLLGVPAKAIVRTKEEAYKSLDIDLEDDAAVIDAMIENPKLIQRPIVVSGNRAVLGRPPETVLELFQDKA